MSKAIRRVRRSGAKDLERTQQKLTIRILSDLNALAQARVKSKHVRGRRGFEWLAGVVVPIPGTRGDPAPDSVTLTKVSATVVTVTVTLPDNPAPARTELFVYASQDANDFEANELAYSANQPANDQLGCDYTVPNTGQIVYIKLKFMTSSGRKSYLAPFTVNQLATVLGGTPVEVGLQLMN